ncbi:MAG: hypothetical protein L0G48_11500 [Staphylococcus equorum]|nr:hypothetical protein [Staphylococcus equorum]
MKNNEKAKETIVVILALFLTLLWAWPTISMIKAINLSKVTGQITLVQLIIVIIGFLAYVITSLIYLFFIDYSDENVIRMGNYRSKHLRNYISYGNILCTECIAFS